MSLTPILSLALLQQLEQMVDSAVPTTRAFWRPRFFAATHEEATDPRPWLEVIRERLPGEARSGASIAAKEG